MLTDSTVTEEIMRALDILETSDDKMKALCVKYASILEEKVLMQETMKETEKLYKGVSFVVNSEIIVIIFSLRLSKRKKR